jgi:signal transduction histidine kinase
MGLVEFRGDHAGAMLRAVFDRLDVGVAFYDRDLRFIEVNEAFAAMSGVPAALHLGQRLEAVLPRQASQIAPHLQSVLAHGAAAKSVSLRGIRNARTARPGQWLASYYPITVDGVVLAVMVLVTEVTTERRAEAILSTQRDVLERCVLGEPLACVLDRIAAAVAEHSADAAIPSILLLEDGRLVHCSAPLLPKEYVAAMDRQPIAPAAGSCGTAAFRREPVFVRDIESDPLWRDYRDTALRHGLRACWSMPIMGSDADVLGTFALYYREPRDPSTEEIDLIRLMARTAAVLIEWCRGDEARRTLLAREQEARRAAEEDNRGKDEFVATLSHELRTPLNAIMGWTRMLKVSPGDQALAARALAAIERNAEAQARLIEDLLDIARIARGGLQLEIAPVDPLVVAQGALDAIKPFAEGKGVGLVADLAHGCDPIDGDAARLRQVIWNLLTNAVKFTPSGGEVRLVLRQDPHGARVSVIDTGIGIPAELLPHVFERYRQGDSGAGGLGLGLAIATSVVSLHGGSLRAASDGAGRGSRFDLLLPCGKPTPATAGAAG